MMHRTARAIPALASVLAAVIAVGGCSAATAPAGATPAPSASSATASAAGRPGAHFNGPFGSDAPCLAALRAEQVLQARQGKDQNSQSAIDKDLTNFASALNTAAQQEKNPATVKAMTALANDYTALVQSQSGAVQLPDMSTVQNDGAAFDKACSNS